MPKIIIYFWEKEFYARHYAAVRTVARFLDVNLLDVVRGLQRCGPI